MPKKRKTRKQKILTDQKKYVVQNEEPLVASSQKRETQSTMPESSASGMTFSLPTTQTIQQTAQEQSKKSLQTVVISTSEYAYLGKDLIKTALLTGAIALAELLIRFFYLH